MVETPEPLNGEARLTDPRPDNNKRTTVIRFTPVADLAITVTDGQTTAVPGNPLPLVYTIRVTNGGPSDVHGATVVDTFPSQLTRVSWTCEALRGSCAPSGQGNINDSIS